MKEYGARIDATFHCPHFPAISGRCECRKPGTLLYRQAAEQFGIGLGDSLYVGDRDRDIAPGIAFGGFVRLVPSGSTPPEDLALARQRGVLAASLSESVDEYLQKVA
jgi:D-glycero-D-manno-heptose 1,7-bisphosphate phosphatase